MHKHLYWRSIIQYVRNKVAKICVLYLDRGAKWLIYYSLVHSNMNYCLTVWSGASKTSLNSLKIIQKKIIRAAIGLKTTDHKNHTFINTKLFKFKDLYNYIHKNTSHNLSLFQQCHTQCLFQKRQF